MPRFALLEHTDAPDDPAGRHFDLLLEAATACRTWRLVRMPEADGVPVAAVELPPHRLAWLDHEAGEVSGGRGFARRVDAGEFDLLSGDAQDISEATTAVLGIRGAMLRGRVRLTAVDAGWAVAWLVP